MLFIFNQKPETLMPNSEFRSGQPSPDGSGYPFVAAFDTKDISVQQETASKKIKKSIKKIVSLSGSIFGLILPKKLLYARECSQHH